MKTILIGLKANAGILFPRCNAFITYGYSGGIMHSHVIAILPDSLELFKSEIRKLGFDPDKSLKVDTDLDYTCYLVK